VLRVLGKLPKNFVSRNEFVKLALETGMPKSIALFLTLSLKNQDETKNLGWKFNLRVLKTMLEDFEKKDLMGFLNSEAAHANNCQYHVVQAEKNSRWQGKVLKEVQELYKTHKITLHYLKGAGHWVHTDNPEGILEFMRQANGRV